MGLDPRMRMMVEVEVLEEALDEALEEVLEALRWR